MALIVSAAGAADAQSRGQGLVRRDVFATYHGDRVDLTRGEWGSATICRESPTRAMVCFDDEKDMARRTSFVHSSLRSVHGDAGAASLSSLLGKRPNASAA